MSFSFCRSMHNFFFLYIGTGIHFDSLSFAQIYCVLFHSRVQTTNELIKNNKKTNKNH